jgi:hypothetical protein
LDSIYLYLLLIVNVFIEWLGGTLLILEAVQAVEDSRQRISVYIFHHGEMSMNFVSSEHEVDCRALLLNFSLDSFHRSLDNRFYIWSNQEFHRVHQVPRVSRVLALRIKTPESKPQNQNPRIKTPESKPVVEKTPLSNKTPTQVSQIFRLTHN